MKGKSPIASVESTVTFSISRPMQVKHWSSFRSFARSASSTKSDYVWAGRKLHPDFYPLRLLWSFFWGRITSNARRMELIITKFEIIQ